MRTGRLGLSGGKARAARANGERLLGHDCMRRVCSDAERRAPSLGVRSMRALRRAAAALPVLSRRSRLSRRRVRCSEPTPSGSRRPPRGASALLSSFRAVPGLRSGSARALAGAFVLLALGVLAAPQAEAQTVDYVPAVTGATPGSGDEGTTIVFRMRLLDGNASNQPVGAPAGGLTVNLTVSDATDGGDFLAPATEGAHTVTFKEGESIATYSVPTVDDNQDEPRGKINIAIVAGAGYTTPTSLQNADAIVRDNDAVAGVRLWVEDAWHTRGTSSSHLNINEAGGTQALTATVTMLGEDGKPVSRSSDTEVTLAFGGIELEEDDFISGEEATVTIPAGRSRAEKVLHVTPNHDTEQEDPERFDLTAGFIIVGVGSYEDRVPLYLVDDGWEEPIATIAAGTSPVTEGTDATFTVTLSRAVSTAISVYFNIWWSREGSVLGPEPHLRRRPEVR